jgi:anti-sigma regulatory factor (Ser/Thr protein kinase)
MDPAGADNQQRQPLCERCQPAGLEMRFASDPTYLPAVRHAIEAYYRTVGLDDKTAADVGLCLNEALANIIRHAYGGACDRPIVVRAESDGRRLRLTVRDWGCGRVPGEVSPAVHDPLTPGGLGLICLRTLMDEVSFQPQPDGMLLVMEKKAETGNAE